jgi:HEAT repeat protein
MQLIIMLRIDLRKLVLAAALVTLSGCSPLRWPNVWPFPEPERTAFLTPAIRVDTIRQVAGEADGTDSPEQRALTDQLARQIQIEPDPLVRRAIIKAMTEFKTPLAQQVVEAGLRDTDAGVRQTCCQVLGDRGDPQAVGKLANALRDDRDLDVRLAAAEALGNLKTPEAAQALIVALDDRDPAMQYVGVESMKSITGEDYGNDVRTWRQVAAGEKPDNPQAPSIATRIREMSPF